MAKSKHLALGKRLIASAREMVAHPKGEVIKNQTSPSQRDRVCRKLWRTHMGPSAISQPGPKK
jgi:hypothetical protein